MVAFENPKLGDGCYCHACTNNFFYQNQLSHSLYINIKLNFTEIENKSIIIENNTFTVNVLQKTVIWIDILVKKLNWKKCTKECGVPIILYNPFIFSRYLITKGEI